MLAVRSARSILTSLYNWQVTPARPFADTPAPEAPDYTDHGPRAWSAYPGRKQNSAELRPKGETDYIPEADRPVDCFYVNPTTYGIISGRHHYNAPLNDWAANGGIEGCLATQASCFNTVCRIYAPRYRQCTLAGVYYSPGSLDNRLQALEVAYHDIKRAFQHFISDLCVGDRPFLVAAHSQGTRMLVRLLAECVEGTPLMDRLVAAYLVGGGVPLGLFGREFKQLHVCQGPLDHGCVIGWDSVPETFPQRHHFYYSEAGRMHYSVQQGKYVIIKDEDCLTINPLTWKPAGSTGEEEEEEADEGKHMGVLTVTWRFSWWALRFVVATLCPPLLLDDDFRVFVDGDYVVTSEVERHVAPGVPVPALYRLKMFGGTYHMQDFSLFYFNIRQNVKDRVQAFLQRRDKTDAAHA